LSKKPKVVILGATGMLGTACCEHFSRESDRFELHVSVRGSGAPFLRQFNTTSEFHFDPVETFESWRDIPTCDYVINCIGLIKQDPSATVDSMNYLNGTFVNDLARYCRKRGTKLIHISTDSVFSGKRGLYVESDPTDPVEPYGVSKLAGEGTDFMCLRTSTIGKEIHSKRCIMEWLKSQEGKTVNGYINQYWNGITAKEYARMCDRIITQDLYVEGIRHVYTNVITKYHLLVMLREKLNIDVEIVPTNLPHKIDRTLISEYDTNKKLQIPTVEQMIETDI
jgi:dTDP-4-dehydrorhamnose reductase